MLRPSLHQLEIFCKVVQLRSMTRAAEELYLAPSSISMQLQDLEQKLGTPLLIHAGRRLEPTEAGSLLYRRALGVLASLDALERDLGELGALESGRLRLASSRTIGSHVVLPALQTFGRRHPRVDVEYHLVVSSQVAAAAVIDGRAEVALLGRVADQGILDVTPFLDEPLVLVVSPAHPLASAPTLSPRALDGHTVLLREQPVLSSAEIRARLAEAGARPVFRELSSTEAIKAGAVAGLGAAVLPETSIEAELKSGDLVARPTAAFAPRRTIHLAQRRHAPLSAAARAFLDLVRESHPWPTPASA